MITDMERPAPRRAIAAVRPTNALRKRARTQEVDWDALQRRHERQTRARDAWKTGARTPLPRRRRLASLPAESRQYAPPQSTAAARDRGLILGAGDLLTVIVAEVGKAGKRILCNEYLAKRLGVSVSTIKRRVRSLDQRGFIACWPELDGRGVCVGRWIAVLAPARPHWHDQPEPDRPHFHRSMWPGRNRDPQPVDFAGGSEVTPTKDSYLNQETAPAVDTIGDKPVDKPAILAYVHALAVPSGVSKRFDCPACGAKGCFSVTNTMGLLQWHCFRAACPASGKETVPRSLDEVRRSLDATPPARPFSLPEHFTSVLSNERALAYLSRNHCLDAYAARRADLRYDPRQDRAVFLVREAGKVVNAVGRALGKGGTPKWLHYGTSPAPYLCGGGATGVVVEDCASATAVSGVALGIALLGTDWKHAALAGLRGLDRLIVALDPDATRKGLELSRYLTYYTNAVSVIRLPDDLKYFSESDIAAMLGV